jgi:hypothetical protein
MRRERRHVTVDLVEHEDQTTARAVLAEDGRTRQGTGDARRKRTDFDVPEIGDELAVGRALIDLGTRLIEDAAHDIESIEGREVILEGPR